MPLEYKFESLAGGFPRDLTPAHVEEIGKTLAEYDRQHHEHNSEVKEENDTAN